MVDLASWMAAYERAWRSDAVADIEALFTDDAVYLTSPDADPISGRAAIVEWWRHEDEPGEPEFEWWPVVVADATAVVQGRTAYTGSTTYLNLWVVSFAPDGRANSFTEWWMVED